MNGLKLKKEKLAVRQDEKILQIEPGDVYYFEAVDNRVFLYSDKNVYETRMKLYELERRFAGTDFFRVSKSVILNLARFPITHRNDVNRICQRSCIWIIPF